MSLRLQAAAVIVFFLSVCASTTVFAQADSIGVGTAKAKIVSPISISQTQNLLFGEIKTTGSGTVAVAAQNDAVSQSSAINRKGDTPHAAVFSVTGEPSLQFSISLPSSISMGTNRSVISLTRYPTGTLQLDNTGHATVRVGGTLNFVGTFNSFSVYQTNVAVTVTYN